MRTRRILLVLIAVGVLAGVLVVVFTREREPEYQGKSVSQWLQKYGEENSPPLGSFSPIMSYPSQRLRGEANDAIQHIGTNAIPWLLHWIDREDSYGDRPRIIRSYGAVGGFSSLGPEAAGAIPELSKMLNRTNYLSSSSHAADALAFIGQDALPALMGALTNQQLVSVRRSVIRSMAAMGTNARPAIPNLVRFLNDKDEAVASNAALTLGTLRIEPSLVVPALVEKLRGSNGHSRFEAAYALLGFGREARQAVPALLDLLKDPDEMIRHAATNTLREVDPQALERATP